MPRNSQRENTRQKVREYLAIAEAHSADEHPLDVRSVASRLTISRTTIYKYQLNREINAAESVGAKRPGSRENRLNGKLSPIALVICRRRWRRSARRIRSLSRR